VRYFTVIPAYSAPPTDCRCGSETIQLHSLRGDTVALQHRTTADTAVGYEYWLFSLSTVIWLTQLNK